MNAMNFATREVRTIAPSSSIDRAISLMEEHAIHHLVAVHDNQVVGMLSDRDILISTGWMLSVERRVNGPTTAEGEVIGPTLVGQIMSRPPICLAVEQSARDAAMLMVDHRISALPVLQTERLVGILSDSDLMKWLEGSSLTNKSVETFLRRSIGEFMRSQVVTVSPQTLLVEVTDIFRRRRLRHLPVTENKLIVGMISDRDVRRSIGWSSVREVQAECEKFTVGAGFLSTAAEIMQTNVVWTTRKASLHDALRLMLANQIHSLPVVEAGKLVGIITQTDFIKSVAHRDLL